MQIYKKYPYSYNLTIIINYEKNHFHFFLAAHAEYLLP